MAQINQELGIRLGHNFNNYGFLNAGGSGWHKVKIAFVATLNPPAAVYLALSNNDKSRYKKVWGNISNPSQERIKELYAVTKRDYPFSENMTSDELKNVIDKLTTQYNWWGSEGDKKAGEVARNRKDLDKGDNKRIIDELAYVRAMMHAINDYRAEAIKAYDKAFEREEKAEQARLDAEAKAEQARLDAEAKAEQARLDAEAKQRAVNNQGGSPKPLPPQQRTDFPTGALDGGNISGGAIIGGSSGDVLGGGGKDKVNKMLIYGIGGIAIIGLGYYFITKK